VSLSGHGSLRGRCEPPHDGVGSAGLVMSTTRLKPYRASLAHGRLPWWLLNTTTLAHRCRRGASIPSRWRCVGYT